MATFTDFNTSLVAHPINKDISLKSDVEAIKQSIRNLVLTDKMERPFQPTIGCDVRKNLFENFSPQTVMMVKTHIVETIEQYEPRCNLLNVETSPDEDNNTLNVTVLFSIINSERVNQLNLVLERVR
tara:strand:- start:3828 stop:4208 length:381 start_codon:yes stop_codon:yes gene_type:complete